MAETTPINFCGMGCGEVPDDHFSTCDGRQIYARKWDCKCGASVVSVGGRDTSCGCGQEYNGSGQRLRSNWRDNPSNYDENVGDLEGYEMSCLASE